MQPLYKLMEINSERLVIDRNVYQRKQHNDKITQIVASWDERIANEPKVPFAIAAVPDSFNRRPARFLNGMTSISS